ncbi:Phosphopantetheine attachment site [Bauldia litoralis]|uniref:Phosphopantetheine attachment site n=1 Tax=Bauldia litoralis TaxID=665467 RepID=A0A1G6DUW0_9HYPH|nr:phosphopantetheine-binding protein [Bauldia litoralis]SDB48964.1 Phosphopantetheine attachment site [Bauldia litoralis]
MQPLKTFVSASEDRLVALVEDILARNHPDGQTGRPPISTGQDLIEIGLTSVDMVNLMLAVEAEFDVTIPPVQITPENFRSVDSITTLVSRLLDPQEAA